MTGRAGAPVRLSQSALAREVSSRFNILKTTQFPATNMLIAAATESQDQFALCRMGWLAEQLRAESLESRVTRKILLRSLQHYMRKWSSASGTVDQIPAGH